MDLNEYQTLAARTAPLQLTTESERLATVSGSHPKCRVDLLHGTYGAVTEAGELMDIVKRHDFYAKDFDWAHVIEEAGDLLWYVAMLARAAGTTLEDIATKNIAKLLVRYPDKFTAEDALNRNLSAERDALTARKGKEREATSYRRAEITREIASLYGGNGLSTEEAMTRTLSILIQNGL